MTMQLARRLIGGVLTLFCGMAVAQQGHWSYRIQPGDTLLQLAETYLEPPHGWRDLQRLNQIEDPLKLPPGRSLRLPLAWLQREAGVARVVHVQGEAQLLRPGAAPAALAGGMLLRPGDSLRTGPASSLSLRFVDGSRLLLTAESALSLEQLLVHGRGALISTRLRLERGGADSLVTPDAGRPPQYELRTPSLNLGVRGTEFRVQAGAERTAVQVLAGAIAVAGAAGEGRGGTRLAAGQGALARPGQAPQVQTLPDAPSLAGLPARIEQLPLRLGWPAQAGSVAYRAQVFAAGDFERLLLDGVFREPGASWPDLPDGSYSLRVRGIDALGLEGRAAEAHLRVKARPEPPFQLAPGAVVYGDTVRLQWTEPLAAQAYRLQIAATPDFAAPLLDRADLSGAAHEQALPHGRYHWRLASIAAGPEPGPFGAPRSFELRPLPPVPPPAEPALGERELLLRWAAQPGYRYQLQWSADPGFAGTPQSLEVDAGEARLPRPEPGSYYLRLRALDAHGQAGPWGGAQRLEVPAPRWPWLLLLLPLLFAL
jgi:hypothetical protein